MSHRHILLPIAALAVAACGDHSLVDSGPSPVNSEVASITLAADSLMLDMRSAAPQTIRYSIVNAAGESLCGRVPVSVQADTAAFSAQLSPTDPCLITLTPRAERSGWLRVRAGEKHATAQVSVYRRRYRWAFDLPSGPHVVGKIMEASFTVWGDNDKPMGGVTADFIVGVVIDKSVYRLWRQRVITGPDGTAKFSWTADLNTHVALSSKDPLDVGSAKPYVVSVTTSIPDATGRSEYTLWPDAPHHIAFLAYSVMTSASCENDGSSCWVNDLRTYDRTVSGDTLKMSRSETWYPIWEWWWCPTDACPPPLSRGYVTNVQQETLAAIVADQYGNPTGTIPKLVANVSGERIVSVRDPYIVGTEVPCCSWSARLGGRVAVTSLTGIFAPITLTFTAPNLPSRTVTVFGAPYSLPDPAPPPDPWMRQPE